MYILKTYFLYIFILYLVLLLLPPLSPMRELYFFKVLHICWEGTQKYVSIKKWISLLGISKLLNTFTSTGNDYSIKNVELDQGSTYILLLSISYFRLITFSAHLHPKGSIYICNQTSLLSCYFYGYWFRFYLGRLKKIIILFIHSFIGTITNKLCICCSLWTQKDLVAVI